MSASDHLQPQQFAGKYSLSYESAFVPTVVARRLDKDGNPGRAAGMLAHAHRDKDGNPGGEIMRVQVSGPHRRKGLATAMLDYARQAYPGVHHSTALSPDGRAWSTAEQNRGQG
jgi:GNAT superfamily N-acetyltransferase